MENATRVWRVELPVGGASPFRIGVLVRRSASVPADPETTATWLAENRRQLKLDQIVEMIETPDGPDARSFVAANAQSAAVAARLAGALAAVWRTEFRLAPRRPVPLTFDGVRAAPNGRGSATPTAVHVLGSNALRQSILKKNRPVLADLVQSLRSSMGVIPFVGAGLSAAFDFPQWADLLRQLASPTQRKGVERHLAANDFERAAELLYDRGRAADRLQVGITSSFDRPISDAEFAGKAVALLPYLTAGPVVTTNYDRVLERAFELADRPFTGPPILGADPDEIVPAIQRNERVLFKIHGDCRTRRGLTLTLQSYELAYGSDRAAGRKVRDKLQGMLPILLTNRPFLFLGCSLGTDRTLDVVKSTFKQHARIGHYAILAADHDVDEFDRRAEALASIGIRVLWYMPGAYQEVRALLRELLEATSMDALPADARAQPALASPALAGGAATQQTATNARLPEPLALPPALRERIRRGRMVYFLGAAASGPLLGEEFYRDIARNNNVPEVFRSRSDIAQHLVDRNARSTLVNEIANMLHVRFPEPSGVHRRFAELAGKLRRSARSVPRLVLMTTNYDAGLETAFEQSGTAHHLFVYQPHDRFEGQFIHRTPSGELRVIVRPEKLYELEGDDPVIVKMNGGPRLAASLPDVFSVATRDFYRLAARVPAAFPAFLVGELMSRSFFFLSHGLKEADVEELIRFNCAQENAGRSWALKYRPEAAGPDEAARQYWGEIGVDFLWGPIDACMAAIEQAADS